MKTHLAVVVGVAVVLGVVFEAAAALRPAGLSKQSARVGAPAQAAMAVDERARRAVVVDALRPMRRDLYCTHVLAGSQNACLAESQAFLTGLLSFLQVPLKDIDDVVAALPIGHDCVSQFISSSQPASRAFGASRCDRLPGATQENNSSAHVSDANRVAHIDCLLDEIVAMFFDGFQIRLQRLKECPTPACSEILTTYRNINDPAGYRELCSRCQDYAKGVLQPRDYASFRGVCMALSMPAEAGMTPDAMAAEALKPVLSDPCCATSAAEAQGACLDESRTRLAGLLSLLANPLRDMNDVLSVMPASSDGSTNRCIEKFQIDPSSAIDPKICAHVRVESNASVVIAQIDCLLEKIDALFFDGFRDRLRELKDCLKPPQ
jgi:hypothetical protein